MSTLTPARLRPADVVRVGASGIRTRPLRAALSALGIAIGIAAMVSVLGISSSGREDLARRLDALGTNLLTVQPGTTMFTGAKASLPDEAVPMIGRMDHVESVSATGELPDARVYRNDRVPRGQSGGIAVRAARVDLPTPLGLTLSTGTWLTDATGAFPTVVLGARAARSLGLSTVDPETQVWLGGRPFTVIGILDAVPLVPELDYTAFVGWHAAKTVLGFDGHATSIYLRTDKKHVTGVQPMLAATVNPQHPTEVKVSRPSDALIAQQATDKAFTGLLLGLGGVALLVGGIGVANTMIISVLERRAEIGLRRSLGATRGQVRVQFLAESLLLSMFGGVGGAIIGSGITGAYATAQSWPTVVPPPALAAGVGATLVIGGLAGLYPAIRAARLAPTEALASP